MTNPVLDRADLPAPALEEVGDGMWAYVQLDGTWGLNNAAVLAGSEGVTLVDTCFTERRTRALLEAVDGLGRGPVRTLVNTHHHGDHTHGNWLVPGATVVGHERCREEVLASGTISEVVFPGVEWGEIQVRAPFVTFTDRLTVWVDELRVDLLFVGPAHTTNDVVAWVPERRTLFAGGATAGGPGGGPRRLRRLARPRAPRRQPAPGPGRAPGARTRGGARRRRRLRRHGRLQRRSAPPLPRVMT
jgi:cyclase